MKTIQQTVEETLDLRFKNLEEKLNISNSKIASALEKKEEQDKKVEIDARKKAFSKFLKSGKIDDEVRTKGFWDNTVNQNGSITVPVEYADELIKAITKKSVMMNLASIDQCSFTQYRAILEKGEPEVQWVGDLSKRKETNMTTFESLDIYLEELSAIPKISRQLVQDSMFDLENELVNQTSTAFSNAFETAFFYGTGHSTNQPMGLLTGVEATYTDINYDNLVDAIYSVDYENCAFILNRKTMKAIKKIKTTDGSPLFVETKDITQKYDGFIMGYPVFFSSAVKVNEIVFGDMTEAYRIVTKPNGGHSLLVDELTSYNDSVIRYLQWARIGGAPVKKDAFVYFKPTIPAVKSK